MFILKLRHQGKQQMLTLGQFPAMMIADARVAARKIKNLSALGVSPADKGKKTPTQGRAKLSTVADLVEAYIEQYAKPS